MTIVSNIVASISMYYCVFIFLNNWWSSYFRSNFICNKIK